MTDAPKAARRIPRKRVVVCLILLAVVGGGLAYDRHQFPHGRSHCCNKGIYFVLLDYAVNHGGRFPDAGGSAASLALMADEGLSWELIVGKGGNAKAAEEHFRTHGTLFEEFSNWHYVPGLTTQSEPGLALFWDKTGLAHNGMRQKPVRYEVCFVEGACGMIKESEWPSFLARQEHLRAQERIRAAKPK